MGRVAEPEEDTRVTVTESVSRPSSVGDVVCDAVAAAVGRVVVLVPVEAGRVTVEVALAAEAGGEGIGTATLTVVNSVSQQRVLGRRKVRRRFLILLLD